MPPEVARQSERNPRPWYPPADPPTQAAFDNPTTEFSPNAE